MSREPLRLLPLDVVAHDRAAFCCASIPLNRYLKEQVRQDMRRRMAACFVALADHSRIAGYYTLSSASLLLSGLPGDLVKRLPRYPTVPAVRMGRLAVDQAFVGQGLGAALLADALRRSARAEIAAWALMVWMPRTKLRRRFTGTTASSPCPIRRMRCFCHWQRRMPCTVMQKPPWADAGNDCSGLPQGGEARKCPASISAMAQDAMRDSRESARLLSTMGTFEPSTMPALPAWPM